METYILLASDSGSDWSILSPHDKFGDLVLVDILDYALGEILRIYGVALISRHRVELVSIDFLQELAAYGNEILQILDILCFD